MSVKPRLPTYDKLLKVNRGVVTSSVSDSTWKSVLVVFWTSNGKCGFSKRNGKEGGGDCAVRLSLVRSPSQPSYKINHDL